MVSQDQETSLLISGSPGEVRVAFHDGVRPTDIDIYRSGAEAEAGDIFLGRVVGIDAGLDAAFVDIGEARHAYLEAVDAAYETSDADENAPIGDLVHEGEVVLVQIGRPAMDTAHSDGKGAKLTSDISLADRLIAYKPFGDGVGISRSIRHPRDRERLTDFGATILTPEEGIILRTAAMRAGDDELTASLERLRHMWSRLQDQRQTVTPPMCLLRLSDPILATLRDGDAGAIDRILVDDAALLADTKRIAGDVAAELADRIAHYDGAEAMFEHFGVEAAIERALEPHVALPSGGNLVIEATEAFTAIDVNAGGTEARGDRRELARQVNLEAAVELAHQIRLRGIAGLIVVDFLDLGSAEDRTDVLHALRDTVADDPMPVQVLGLTSIGLAQLTRRRTRPSLAQSLMAPCPACSGAGSLRSAETVALAGLRAVLRAARATPGSTARLQVPGPAADALAGPALAAKQDAEAALGHAIEVERRDDLPPDAFEVSK